MSNHKIVYLIVEKGDNSHRQTFWRSAGNAFICRDGSLNVKLDIHPGLTFNIRDPKSNGEREEAEGFLDIAGGNAQEAEAGAPIPTKIGAKKPPKSQDDIPF